MLLLIARLLLAGVFAVAGVAKLADLHGSRRAAVGFGVPHRLAPVLAVLVPLFELAVAIALLPDSTVTVGATGALVLLSLFTLAIVWSMIRGEAPDCHCFGRLHSASAGWSSLGRNLALGALASLVLVAGWNHAGLSAVGWIGDLSGAGIVAVTLGIVLVLLATAG